MYLTSNPREAWAMAFETGIRTQASADLAESQSDPVVVKSGKRKQYLLGYDEEGKAITYTREQVSASQDVSRKGGPGASFGSEYQSVYSAIAQMERENPVLANVGHWLSLNDTEQANRYHDDVFDTVLTRLISMTPAWGDWREKRKERAKALIQARMVQDRLDVDGMRPGWTPQEVCVFASEYLGIKIIRNNWYQDGWVAVWELLGLIIKELETSAMKPIEKTISQTNKEISNFLKHAA
ncbi:hypothetical protein DFO67_10427 [Modicisalibacter xianhensis]|uniref:Uncharacterized protein n=2 Tax=Modicisalibacter xianhensis TaxID=442341 RepID=A0A4R8FVC4_9GAMM|nr:hypothetical protein DFO67_10427 [Halomonas xianhensis]